jgi:hypothetical protein
VAPGFAGGSFEVWASGSVEPSAVPVSMGGATFSYGPASQVHRRLDLETLCKPDGIAP